jgi:phytoene desaturase
LSKVKTIAIIGGGVAGLSAGGLLSRAGLKVKLFEANDKLGGSCASTTIGGYTFHDGALYLAFPGILDRVFERLGLDRPALLPLRKIAANQTTTLPDGSTVTFGEGLDIHVTGKNERARTAQLQDELDGLLKKWLPVYRLFADDILLHPLSLPRLISRGWRQLPKLRGTVASEINKLFSDEAVRAAMSGVLLYSGMPPQLAPVQSILGLVAMLTDGFHLPERGMGRIPLALSEAMARHGGEIFLKSKITRIAVRNGRVLGVEVDDKELIEADAVVSTLSGMLTFGALLDEQYVPSSLRQKVQGAPLSHKALVVQLGLSNRVNVPSHSNSTLPMMDEQYQVFEPTEDEVRWPTYLVPTVTVPELAPPDRSIIEMYPPIDQSIPADRWEDEEAERIAQSAIRALARNHKIKVFVKRVVTPKDFRDRMHLYQGAIYGLSPNAGLRAQFLHGGPIPGLFQAGQTTYPGYGVGPAAMSGILAAQLLLQETAV